MNAVIKIAYALLLVLAGALFFGGLVLHLESFFGFVPPGAINPDVIFDPAMILMTAGVFTSLRIGAHVPQRQKWKLLRQASPQWLRWAMYGLFFYGLVIWAFMAWKQYEDLHVHVDPTLFLSAMAMIISVMTSTIIYPVYRNPALLTGRTCANGHDISPLDKFCPQCSIPTPLER